MADLQYNVIQLAQQTAAKREKETNPENATSTALTGGEERSKQSQAGSKHAARKRKAEEMAQSDSTSRTKMSHKVDSGTVLSAVEPQAGESKQSDETAGGKEEKPSVQTITDKDTGVEVEII